MKRLRHPIRAIREPFGTAGLVVAMIALVAALGGTALAASKLNSTQKKEVEKIAKKFAGKPGANGTNGTNGSPGAKGDTGSAGGTGPAGKSVVIGATAPSCTSGGKTIEVAGEPATKQNVCNGEPGVLHPGETLPPGATETGAWSFGPTNETVALEVVPGLHAAVVPVASFAIPLAEPLEEAEVHYARTTPEDCSVLSEPEKAECEAKQQAVEEACPGTAEHPAAEPGNLCVYGGFEEAGRVSPLETFDPTHFLAPGAATTGASELFEIKTTNNTIASGTWAVTEKE